jgi:iron complex outermembrane recepter protein
VIRSSNLKFVSAIQYLLAAVLLCVVDAVQAEEAVVVRPRIDELVVTGIREQRLAKLPRSANVITAEDIALLPATDIVDIIAREANVQLRGIVGNDRLSGVDVRGQGDTYNSNVLVLVDGIRINPADQAPPDFSSIPLDQIERIEVVRGANSVRYGNGAVGGVINIITRRASNAAAGTTLNARARAGSYNTVDTGVGGSWVGEQWSFIADAGYFDSDGYRDNSQLEKKDLALRIGYDPLDWFGLAFGGVRHRDEYGLPGPVSAEAFYDGTDADRRASKFPFDGGSTQDDRLRLDLILGNDATGELLLSLQARERVNPFRLGLASPDTLEDTITEERDAVDAKYQKNLSWLDRDHSFYLGYDAATTDYAREDADNPAGTKRGFIRQQAWFTALDIGLADTLNFSTGYRQDSFRIKGQTKEVVTCVPLPFPPPFDQDCTATQVEQSQGWHNSAAEAGLVYSPSDNSNWFVSFAQSFRNPNVDDLILADGDLGPQTANHWDIGVRQFWGSVVEFSFALFYSKTKNEILLSMDPTSLVPTMVNRNADEPTKRKGFESDVRWYATDDLSFNANVGYTNARFAESDTYIPLVPKWTGGLGVQWSFLSDWAVNVSSTYVGSRFDGNDFNNTTYRKLSEYQIIDMKLSYQWAALQFYAGIDNLTNEVYAASAYSEQYYPMPDRNYYAGVTYTLNL